jgi:hypothetical protein
LHHEFSSILYYKYQNLFSQDAWVSANSSGFSYGNGGVAAIVSGSANEDLDDTFLQQGVLNSYGQAAIEEDFNEFAQFLFLGDKGIWQAAVKYPNIKKKIDLFITFYHTIDRSFTEEFFRKLIN